MGAVYTKTPRATAAASAHTEYGVNSVYLESYWNQDNPAPSAQARVFDNVVVSTQRIGCGS